MNYQAILVTAANEGRVRKDLPPDLRKRAVPGTWVRFYGTAAAPCSWSTPHVALIFAPAEGRAAVYPGSEPGKADFGFTRADRYMLSDAEFGPGLDIACFDLEEGEWFPYDNRVPVL